LMHFGMDAPSFSFINNNVTINYPGTIPNGLMTYTAPTGVGSNEPAIVTLKNCSIDINQTAANSTIDPKLIYNSINVNYGFLDTSMYASQRYLRMPLVSKSIGTPATTTSLLSVTLPAVITNYSGFSANITATLQVSNAESETAGSPSSLSVKALWQMVRDSVPTVLNITDTTIDKLTSSSSSSANNITDLTLSYSATGTASAILSVASVQTGANNAAAYISGYVEITYAGGYSRAPTIALL